MSENRKPCNDFSELGGTGESEQGELSRYTKAKNKGLSNAYYIQNLKKDNTLSDKIKSCGSYLVFRDYFNINKHRLCGMKSCHEHLLCPLCAIRRAGKATSRYMERLQIVLADNPKLKPYMVTLTVKDGENLAERFTHLKKSVQLYNKYRHNVRMDVETKKAKGAVWSYEIKRGKNSNEWHPHVHMIWLCEDEPDQAKISNEWRKITGDSFIVDCRPLRGKFDNENGDFFKSLCEVFKYAVKFSDQPASDTYHCYDTLKRTGIRGKPQRLLGANGLLYGVKVPEKLTDNELENEPYIEYFYRHILGEYVLQSATIKKPISTEPQRPIEDEKQIYLDINYQYSKTKKPEVKDEVERPKNRPKFQPKTDAKQMQNLTASLPLIFTKTDAESTASDAQDDNENNPTQTPPKPPKR